MLESLKARCESVKNHCKNIKDLSTDGCSAAPDLWFRECCETHDYHYRNNTLLTRWEADRVLWNCIRRKTHGGVILATIYWMGVRLLGWRAWKKFPAILLVLFPLVLSGCGGGITQISSEPIKVEGEIACCKVEAVLGKEYEEILLARTQNEDGTFSYVVWAKGVKAFEGQRITKEWFTESFEKALRTALLASGVSSPGEAANIIKKMKDGLEGER